jgi:hypothetical protein
MGSSDEYPNNPDYPIQFSYIEGIQRLQSVGRKDYQRLYAPPQRVFQLVFSGRSTADKNEILQHYREFEGDYFVLVYPDFVSVGTAPSITYVDRSFPVRYRLAPQFEFVSNDNYNISLELLEAVDCVLASEDYPDPDDGHPTVTIPGVTIGSDQYFVYGGYGFVYTGTGTLALDGAAVTAEEIEIPLNLHRVYVTGGSGTLEAVI